MAAIITDNGIAVATAGALLVIGVISCCGGEKDAEEKDSVAVIGAGENKKKKNQESVQPKAQKKAQKAAGKEVPKSKEEIDDEFSTTEVSSKKSKKTKGKNATSEKVAATEDNSASKKKKGNKKKGSNKVEKTQEASNATEVVTNEDSLTSASSIKKQEVQSPPIEDGWTTVEPVSKGKKTKEKAAEEPLATPAPVQEAVAPKQAEEAAEPSAPVEVKPTQPNTTVSIDPKKIGIVIGPKGSTMKRIEELTHCRLRTIDQDPSIQAKSAHIRVEGPDLEGVRAACQLITDLCSKGYSAKLEGGDFSESYVEIPARSVPDLVGSGGIVIKALRDGTGTIVNLPPQKKLATGTADKLVKVTIAGPKAGVVAAKEAIGDILTKHYSSVTHPGFTHATFEIEDWQVARFCGKAGSNIRHIQGDSKARVHIPRDNAEKKTVLIVGTASQVAVAKKHVTRILENIKEQANRISSEESFASAHRASKTDEDEEPHEEWMDEYLYKR